MVADCLLRLERQPCYQNCAFSSAAEALACPTGHIELVQDQVSGIVSNAAFDPRQLVYGPSYQNEQAFSPLFARHLDEVLKTLAPHFRGHRLVEIGCGKGHFVTLLRDRGFDVVGFDPAYAGDDSQIFKTVYSKDAAGPRDAVILRHVLEHIASPIEFLRSIAQEVSFPAVIYIEVPCLEWILARKAWFDIFYEHVNYFRLEDFMRMFGTVHKSGHLFGGQYLYVIAELSSLRTPLAATRVRFPSDFMRGRDIAAAAAAAAGPFGVWGAGAKGMMFSSHLKDLGVSPACAIDINPGKQNCFMSRSAVPIVSPQHATDLLSEGATVFVMNSNYLSEIIDQSCNRYSCRTIDS